MKKQTYKYVMMYRRWRYRNIQRKRKVYISPTSKGYLNVNFEGNNIVPEHCNFSGKIHIGYATTLGPNNMLNGNVTLGKYCQLGADVAVHTTNHPINYLSTYINKRLFNGELKKLKTISKTIIGNDVWVGHRAVILGNVKVGDGAIIASGSVVTKDVKPFEIVAGVPAKPIDKRFNDNIIQEILTLKWWDKTDDELVKIKDLFFKDLKDKKTLYN